MFTFILHFTRVKMSEKKEVELLNENLQFIQLQLQ